MSLAVEGVAFDSHPVCTTATSIKQSYMYGQWFSYQIAMMWSIDEAHKICLTTSTPPAQYGALPFINRIHC